MKGENADFLTEGRFIKSDSKQRYTLGVVYEPLVVDSQDEYSTAEEIEKACWEFNRLLRGSSKVNKIALDFLEQVLKALREDKEITLDLTELEDEVEKAGGVGLGFMHELWDEDLGEIVESYIAPDDLVIVSEKVKKGTWLMGIVWSSGVFEKVENGEITGLSMGGKATKIPVKEVI